MNVEIQQFLMDPKSGLHTRSSKATYRKVLGYFRDFLEDKPIEKITRKDCAWWVASFAENLAPATVSLRISVLNGFFDWAEAEGKIIESPAYRLAKRFKPGSKPVRLNHWLNQEQVREILALPRPIRDQVVLRLGFNVGLRRQEIVDLSWSDVDLDAGKATIVGKGGNLSVVYLPSPVISVLRIWHHDTSQNIDRPMSDLPVVCPMQRYYDFETGKERILPNYGVRASGKTVYEVCKKASIMAGIPFAPHDMRRTFAAAVNDKTDLTTTSAALRHSSVGVTERYLQKRQDQAYRATQGIDLGY